MTDILELAANVEALDGPDREVDALIWAFIDPQEHDRRCSFSGMKYAGHVHTKAEKTAHIKRLAEYNAPAFTASLDAAMMLVPEGRQLSMETYDSNGIYPAHVRASAWVQGAKRCFAANPALALVAAALRAKGGEQHGG